MSEQKSTALATTNGVGTAVDQIRQQGMYAVAERKALMDLYKMIQAAEWGRALSEHTQAAMARFCLVAGIEIPSEEIDILGGKPYRNAKHWTKRMLKDPTYMDHELINITSDKAQREEVGAPDYALAVYKVKIRKLASFAPIEKIKSGEITDLTPYVTITWEANWAPSKDGKNEKGKHLDPIGFADPHKTARTRTLRRGAEKAFPSTIAEQERVVVPAERELVANWREITSDRASAAAQLPAPDGPQAVMTGSGEPEASNDRGAEPLPVSDQTKDAVENWTDEERDRARRAYFGALRDAGVEDRKQWQLDKKFPDSFNKFTRDDMQRAIDLLTAPTREMVIEGLGALGFDSIEEYCSKRNREVPTTLRQLKDLLADIAEELDGDV
jgi:hypothetical protein